MVLHYGPYALVYSRPEIAPSVVILSIGIAFLGSYMTICFCEQYRLSKVGSGKQKSKLLSNNAVFFLMALSLGGVTTWAMNFINVSGLQFYAPIIKPPLHVESELQIAPTIISLVVAIIFAFTGLYVGARDRMFAKTKQQIVEMYLAHSSKLSFKEIQKITNTKMILIISTHSMFHIVVGGLIVGSGTIATVCLALNSIDIIYTNVVFDNIGIVVGATFLSWFVSILAFWILFRLLSLYPHLEWLRLASAVLMAFNVYIVRLVCYDSLVFHIVGSREAAKNVFSGSAVMTQAIAYDGTLIASIIFCFVLVLIAFSDLRMWLYDKSAKVTSLETLVETLRKDSPHNAEIITTYMKRHAIVHSLSRELNNSSHMSGNGENSGKGKPTTLCGKILAFIATGCCNFNAINPEASESVNESINEARSEPGSPRSLNQIARSNTGNLEGTSSRRIPKDSLRLVAPADLASGVELSETHTVGADSATVGNTDAYQLV